ncbi:MAG: CDP-alcohol phosphatidyltransferase family protein [Bacteroidales bacterium]|jgi:phosphatidylglycerophosphate synthase|nr:CDP-alcohol phosphatidyltransferase family protein [Bacteroidales bacterium]
MEERKQSVRIQTSLFNAAERKLLIRLAERMPEWVTSDMLTFVGFAGAVIIAAGYALSTINLNWIWFACFGFLVNWFGDSLDGSLARVRKAQRPVYGFFLDHNVDCINESIMFIGVGLSPLMSLSCALLVLTAYLLLSVYVYINAHLKNEFKLTYGGLGPTELRIIAVIISLVLLYVKPLREFSCSFTLMGYEVTLMTLDIVALVIAVVILIMYLTSLVKDAREFSIIDPPKKKE